MTSQTAVKNTTTLLSLTYDYEAASSESGYGSTAGNSGQLMGVTGTIGGTGFGGSGGVGGSATESAAYTYDNLGRLVTSNQTTNSTTAQRRFAYDRWGNRTGVWNATSGGTQIQSVAIEQVSSIPTNRIASVTTNGGSPVDYEYDEAGNVIDDGAHTYEYDAENRVVVVDSGTTAEYEYDHQNRRVKKVVGSAVTHYVWQGGQVLAEHNGATGALLINYTYSSSRMIAKTESGTTRYLLSDRLSTRLVLDTSGSIVGRQATLPFGEELNTTGTPDKHRFTSYERDTESGNDYAVNRGYTASVGRFNQADPYRASGYLVDPRSWNRYSYTRNDPVNRVDPAGLEDFIYNGPGFHDENLGGWNHHPPRTPFPIGSNDNALPEELPEVPDLPLEEPQRVPNAIFKTATYKDKTYPFTLNVAHLDFRQVSGPCDGQAFDLTISFTFDAAISSNDKISWKLQFPSSAGDFTVLDYEIISDSPPTFRVTLRRDRREKNFSRVNIRVVASLARRFEQDFEFTAEAALRIQCYNE